VAVASLLRRFPTINVSGSGRSSRLTAALDLGLTKCLPQIFQVDIEINRSLAGARR
jgi:hypothetical protein